MTILVVDDQPTNRKLLRAQLEAEGHAVLEAVDGIEALAVLERQPVDAVISDILMPRMDGYRFCHKVRQHHTFSALPVILYTSTYDSGSDRHLAKTVGADGYVIKPAPTPVILDALHEAIQKAAERRHPQSPQPDQAYVLQEYSEVLVQKLEERNTELQEALEKLRQAHEEILELNRNLEQRVERRSAELVAAKLEAERANQAKSDFLSRMSHDLRTPLNAIMGFAQVLRLDPLAPEQADSVEHILRGGEFLLTLIDEILDLARIESGRLTLSPEPVSIAEIVAHAGALIQPVASQRGITLIIEVAQDISAFADRQRLNQILLNLLSNAIKYNRQNGTVTVRGSRRGDRVQIDVADTGAGIPQGKLALLFTPFERLGADQAGIEGTGLGLALSKGLAEAMNSTLTVDSVIDRGSVFHVGLPACDVASGDAPARPRRGVTSEDYAATVLYVEDNHANANLMKRILTRRPHVVLLHAPDGPTALEMLRKQRPDFVILDLHLPGMSGEEVLRQIWEDPTTRDIPVATLSADASGASRRRLLASGAIAFLTKPLDIADVLDLLDRVLGGST